MRITADTNLLVRAAVGDHPEQEAAAHRLLSEAELIAIPTAVFCELDWVLKRIYRFSRTDIASVIRKYVASATVTTDAAAAEAGLAVLELGGDFADGVIAHQGRALGGQIFASFDAAALDIIARQGFAVLLPV